ncbi:hypothetical protein NXS19_010819 [Fusarium pseudograminearum]|uniref:AB hydrolase-1 domain-containing protein n=1 Tax=Fusarium pseudograminearum (strain CS3096) TaxID=1028729 RepID=K3UPD2_FUSPC|nr:hypothetical protein FPSE_05648 [Fusarium pseudograminearum CS3096]EKJ74176.1 hypothetical protein FPSE_05648 [Fusarium pseudograminearum CS3096]KAF0637504.1 hypothetical protein FPSE5266_05648 [Fusarium pseudograminearum]UZP43003.1 hypothetical protein NXS19_010819 [Fusarium pseudograminearum]
MLPTIVAVPGAWHTAESFDPIKKILTQKGYQFVSQDAPGLHDANGTCQDDAISLRTNILLPLVEEGKDLVVLMHSYGGMYGSQAVQGLSKKEREQAGKKGGVTGLIYVSAVTPIEGKTTLEMMGTDSKNLPPFVDYDETTGWVRFTGAKEAMYHDIPDKEADHYISLLKDQALNSMNTPITYSPLADENFKGTAGYIVCGADCVVPRTGQETYAAVGGIDRVVTVEKASHAFFATAAEEIVDAVLQLVEL